MKYPCFSNKFIAVECWYVIHQPPIIFVLHVIKAKATTTYCLNEFGSRLPYDINLWRYLLPSVEKSSMRDHYSFSACNSTAVTVHRCHQPGSRAPSFNRQPSQRRRRRRRRQQQQRRLRRNPAVKKQRSGASACTALIHTMQSLVSRLRVAENSATS